jgi:hypothetical protein
VTNVNNDKSTLRCISLKLCLFSWWRVNAYIYFLTNTPSANTAVHKRHLCYSVRKRMIPQAVSTMEQHCTVPGTEDLESYCHHLISQFTVREKPLNYTTGKHRVKSIQITFYLIIHFLILFSFNVLNWVIHGMIITINKNKNKIFSKGLCEG